MHWIWNAVLCFNGFRCVIENLNIGQSPVSKNKHQNGTSFDPLWSYFNHLLIIIWRLFVPVGKTYFFTNIHINQSKQGDQKDTRNEHPIHETNSNLNHNGWKLKMHLIFRTTIQVHIHLLSNTRRILNSTSLIENLLDLLDCPESH